MLEIEVSNILYDPGNMGKLRFPIFYYPGNTGELIFLFSTILEIRRPLLDRGHQAAKKGFSTLNPQFLSIFHQQVRYLLFDVLQVSNLVLLLVYCTPWMNNLPSNLLVISTWGGPENQWNFNACPIHPKIIKMVSQDLQKCPKWGPKRYLKSSK